MSILRLSSELELQAHQARLRAKLSPPIAGTANAQDRPTRRDRKAKVTEIPVAERDVLASVLAALRYHQRVAFVWRQNVGGFEDKNGHRVRFAFAGCADILGMLKDGRFLAVECKRPGGQLTQDQHAFLHKVCRNGGVGFMAQGVVDVLRELGTL